MVQTQILMTLALKFQREAQPQTPLGELTAHPRPLKAGFKGTASKRGGAQREGKEGKGREGDEREREKRGHGGRGRGGKGSWNRAADWLWPALVKDHCHQASQSSGSQCSITDE